MFYLIEIWNKICNNNNNKHNFALMLAGTFCVKIQTYLGLEHTDLLLIAPKLNLPRNEITKHCTGISLPFFFFLTILLLVSSKRS